MTDDAKTGEIEMSGVDASLRELMKEYRIHSIETKKNSLEQFFAG